MKLAWARRGAALALRTSVMALALAVGLGTAQAEELAPWQMVRSLQLLQDRIANGDQAALPMQRRILAMTDKRLRAANRAELADIRNFDAVMVYAMGGGNPATVQALMPDLLAIAGQLDAPPPPSGAEAAEAEPEKPEQAEGEAAAGGSHGESAETEAAGEASASEAGGGGKPEAEAKDDDAAEGHETKPPGNGAESRKRGEAGSGQDEAEGEEKPEAEGHGEAKKDGEGGGAEDAAPPKPGQKRMLALGVYNYGRGRLRDAEGALSSVDPMGERTEVGAYLALIKGSLKANSDPAAALGVLDTARLLAPGTLVEEAALRRSVALAATLGDRPRFLRASGQYVRRFLRSPYASQFADAFVAGAVVLHDGLDLDALGAITAGMAPEQEKVVYLRMARRAAIDNLLALSAYASTKAGAVPDAPERGSDPRAALYAALPDIAAPDTDAALKRLEAIDPSGLTASDRALLEAAKAVIGETLAEPPPPAPPAILIAAPKAPAPVPQTREKAPAPPAGKVAAENGEEPLEAVDDGQTGGQTAENTALEGAARQGAAPEATEAAAEASTQAAAPAAEPVPQDAADAKMAEARKALDAVDQILEDAAK